MEEILETLEIQEPTAGHVPETSPTEQLKKQTEEAENALAAAQAKITELSDGNNTLAAKCAELENILEQRRKLPEFSAPEESRSDYADGIKAIFRRKA